MAFAFTITRKTIMGNKIAVMGTFTNGAGDSGGDIKPGLNEVDFISLQQTGFAVTTNTPVANGTFPLSKGDVTIVTDTNADGIWMAVGFGGL